MARMAPRTVQHVASPRLQLNSFLTDSLDLLNPESAQFATVCKYHSHDDGNLCVYGSSCCFLHLRSLDRPPKCVHHHCSSNDTHPSTVTLKKVQEDIQELRTAIQSLLTFVCPKNTDRPSFAVTPTTSAIKTKTLGKATELDPAEHKSASAMSPKPQFKAPTASSPKPKTDIRSMQDIREAFFRIESESSAARTPSEKHKGKKSRKKQSRRDNRGNANARLSDDAAKNVSSKMSIINGIEMEEVD